MAQREEAREAAEAFWQHHKQVWEASGGTELTEVLGMGVLRLDTVGRRSGARRWVLLTYLPTDDGWLVAASNLGADQDPDWWRNLRAAGGEGTVTVDGQTVPIRARELEGDERAEAFDRFVATYEGYAQYVEWTDRPIPVVLLQR